jgi:hypothetical protein
MTTEVFRSAQEPEKQLEHYSLLDALFARRSRRFGKGMRLNGGPLVYESTHEPVPLSLAEEDPRLCCVRHYRLYYGRAAVQRWRCC